MLETAVIIFREILEIALITGVLLAATHQIPSRLHWILGGMAAGIVGAIGLAIGANWITNAMQGIGQELCQAIILGLAALMIGWTVLWMKRHARAMNQQLRMLGHKVSEGELPLYSLSIVIALAVLREGAEIVLFMHGLLANPGHNVATMVIGGIIGGVAGAAVGTLLYFGLLKFAQKYIFIVTSWLLILLASGLAAQSAGYLIAADILPEIQENVWDSSAWLSEKSFLGQGLHVLIGYMDTPSAMQLLFYGITFTMLAIGHSMITVPQKRS